MNNEQPVTTLADIPSRDRRWVIRVLRAETTGGYLLVATTIVAMAWANSPWSQVYRTLTELSFGPPQFHLTMNEFAADGLLAVFFFVIGIELKHEFVSGTLSSLKQAAVPISAALGGMAVSAAIFLSFNSGTPSAKAWGIPISTDVAFALAVLAIAGSKLPLALRSFLLTLAVVNDLGAIVVIAIFYGHGFNGVYAGAAVVSIAVFALLQRRRISAVWLHLVLACAAWYFMYHSGIHATVAGVALGLAMRTVRDSEESESPGERVEHLLRPISANVCVPVFALLSVGISLSEVNLGQSLREPLLLGIMLGLIFGQPLGVTLGARFATIVLRGRLNPQLSWWDVLVVGQLAAIGFTVALLVSQVSFVSAPGTLDTAKLAIVITNVLAICAALLIIRVRSRIIGRYPIGD